MKLASLRLVFLFIEQKSKATPPKSRQLNDVYSVGTECLEEVKPPYMKDYLGFQLRA